MDKNYNKKKQEINFGNTEIAFKSKTNKDLKRAKFLFSVIKNKLLVKLGNVFIPLALRSNFPIKGLIRNTIFKQFIGGENLEETTFIIKELFKYNVSTILDYGMEGKQDEDSFEKSCNEFIRIIEFAASQKSIPFISIKITALSQFELLEEISIHIKRKDNNLSLDHRNLNSITHKKWNKLNDRINKICLKAQEKKIGILIDAEESWIQNSIDFIANNMMQRFNKSHALIYNTIQFYKKTSLNQLLSDFLNAKEKGYILGIKLVRGAYLEKEKSRSLKLNYPSPIHIDKKHTDDSFNEALNFCLKNINEMRIIIASHNEESNKIALTIIGDYNLNHHHPNIHFSQLFGMSDHITYNLAKSGFFVSKYLPYGPIEEVIPYLMRRAEENTSVSGQTGRELALIDDELTRRRKFLL